MYTYIHIYIYIYICIYICMYVCINVCVCVCVCVRACATHNNLQNSTVHSPFYPSRFHTNTIDTECIFIIFFTNWRICWWPWL